MPLLLLILLLLTLPAHAGPLPDARIGSGFGVAAKPERTSAEDLDQIKTMGFSLVRFDMRWREVERQKGRYDWRDFDDFIAKLRERGLKPLIILQGGNPVYSGMVAVPPEKAFGYSSAPAAPTRDEDVQAFTAFAAAAVARYKGEDIIWELWNEPDILAFWPPQPDAAAFAKLASQACTAMRQSDPQATIIGPGLAHMPSLLDALHKGFLETLLTSPVTECLDSLSIHSYRRRDQAPESVTADYDNKVRRFIKERTPPGRKTLPVVCSEWGYTLLGVTPEQQAAYALRTHLSNLLAGVSLSVWYEWKDSRNRPDDPEAHYGLLNYDGTNKPSGEAVAALLPRIKDAVIEKRLPLDDPAIFAVLLKQPDGSHDLLAWVGNNQMEEAVRLVVDAGDTQRSLPLSLRPQLVNDVGERVKVRVGSEDKN